MKKVVKTKSENLLLSFLGNTLPYRAISLTGQLQILFIDLWCLCAKVSSIELELIALLSSQNLAVLKAGDADIYIGFFADKFDHKLEIVSQIYGVDVGVFSPAKLIMYVQ